MEQYILKSAIVEEIRRFIKDSELYIKYHRDKNDRLRYSFEHQRLAMCELLSFIDTLEVKEVDLEKEINDWRHNYFHGRRDIEARGEYLDRVSQLNLAEHFFELGLKAQKGEEL